MRQPGGAPANEGSGTPLGYFVQARMPSSRA